MSRRKSSSARKPSIAIIGAGRLGAALGLALFRAGFRIEAVVARRHSQARKARDLIGSRRVVALPASRLADLPQTDLVLIATPDDLIGTIARELAELVPQSARSRTALHTSGALPATSLAPLAERGFQIGAIHPLLSVSDPRTGAAALRGANFCLDGDRAALLVARSLVRALEGRSFSIASRCKPLYHAAAVITAGHTVALFDIAAETLAACGIDRRQGQRALLSLLESTVANLAQSDPVRALTGTIARGDVGTVTRHLEALRAAQLTDALAAYRLLSRRSIDLARRRGVDEASLQRIEKALDE